MPSERADRSIVLLAELTKSFASRIALDDLLPLILQRTKEVLHAESASVLLLDPRTREFYFPETSDRSEELEARLRASRFPAHLGIGGHVLRNGKATLVPDVCADPHFYPEIDRETGSQTRNLLCAPLRTERGSIGVVEVRNRQEGAFSQDDLAFLDALADSIATALANSREFEAVRRSEARLRKELGALRRDRARRARLAHVVGESAAIRQVFALVESALAVDIPVLVTGETGVGKECIARAIHEDGIRSHGPFVAVNCGALQQTLLESELFGVRRGAFTDAHADRPGLFEAANGGTLFLDEIAEMSPAVQAKLLRALDEGEIRRVGDVRNRRTDIRVIAATNHDLQAEVKDGRFREDLYYRINVFPICVPPLRNRTGDLPALASHFLARASARFGKQIAGIAPDVFDRFARYEWPGNVRQLEHEIERAVAIARHGSPITTACLSESLRAATRTPHSTLHPGGSLKDAMAAFERDYIETTLSDHGGNVSETARALGVSRQLLHRRIKDLGLR